MPGLTGGCWKGVEKEEAYLARGIGLLALDPVKHLPQALLELLVLGAGVELADEVATGLEGVAREAEGGGAEVLQVTRGLVNVSGRNVLYR